MRAEAKPLIDCFEMRPVSSKVSRFEVYENEDTVLMVSGIGSANARLAVQHLARFGADTDVAAWLNIGVAGHGSFEVGQGFMANCIADGSTGQTLYPLFVNDFGVPTSQVITVHEVESQYPLKVGYDMEAYGFAVSAAKYSTFELIHCYKIVSDNRKKSVHGLTLQTIEKLISDHIDAVVDVGGRLAGTADSVAHRTIAEDPTVPFVKKWRLTVSEREILKKYLNKARVLGAEIKVSSDLLCNAGDASEVLETIHNHLRQHWHTC